MRRTIRTTASTMLVGMLIMSAVLGISAPAADAQDIDQILTELESNGYYIEPGAEGTDSRFADLVAQGQRTNDNWYFLSMADTVADGFADDLLAEVSPRGNVLVYFLEEGGEFVNVQLATDSSESVETQALSAFDGDWSEPEDFMSDVIADYTSLTSSTTTTTTSSGAVDAASDDSDGGFPWGWVAVPAALGGGFWFMSRRGKKQKQDDALETAQKIRAELQTEIDELANDVLVLSSPVDVSENAQAIEFYREATDTYLDISDEVPDVEELEHADLAELSDFGARVAHARWQMDAAEALIAGEPLPEKPKVEPPPPPVQPAPQRTPEQRQQQMPQRVPRPRVPYSPSRRSSGGGLLDILIAGAGMMGSTRGRSRGRTAGGMFGSGSRSRTSYGRVQSGPRPGRSRGRTAGGMFGSGSRSRTSYGRVQSGPRPGGGVFGSSSRSRSSSGSSRRSTSRSTSRSRSRSSSRRSTSKRRRR